MILSPGLVQALSNIVRVLAEAGGEPAHLVRMTWYLTGKSRVYGAAKGNRRGLPARDRPALSGHVGEYSSPD